MVAWTGGGGLAGWLIQLWPAMSGGIATGIGMTVGFVIALLIAHANQDNQIADLKRKLEDKERLLDIAYKLGEFGSQAKVFIKRGEQIPGWAVIDDWRTRLLHYVENHLGKGHRFLLESGAGNEPKPPDTLTNDEGERWIHIQARLMTLKEIIWDVSDKADAIKP